MSPVTQLRPDTVYQVPSFNAGMVVTGSAKTIYVSGLGALMPDGVLVGAGDIAAQAVQTMKNIEAVLAAGGGKLEHLVKLTIYVVEGQPFGPAFEALMAYRGSREATPATTLLFVSSLAEPEFLITIDAVAVVPE